MTPTLPTPDSGPQTRSIGLSVRTKILGTFALTAAVMAVVLWLVLHANRRIDEVTRKIVQHDIVAVNAVKDVEHALAVQDAAVGRYLLTGDPSWREAIESERDRTARALAVIRGHLHGDTDRSLIREITDTLPAYYERTERLLAAHDGGGSPQDVASRLRRENSLLPEIQRNLQALLAVYEAKLEQNRKEADRIAVKYRGLGLSTFAILGGAALALWFLLRLTVVRPIRRLAEGARAYEHGQLEHRVPVLGGDELGDLSRTFNEMATALQQERGRLTEMSITDELTQLKNFRHFSERLEEEVRRAERYGHEISLVLFDIDYFKTYNDAHGHPAGNEVLRVLGRLLRDNARGTDILARYGGEEFAAILPETSKEDALGLAEKIRRLIEVHAFPGEETQPGGALTVSAGVAALPRDANDPSLLLEAADKALYAAKHDGRNRVVPYVPDLRLPQRARRTAGRAG
jgi:diguanylate cyclase (GGDEF)-like protein